MNRAIRKSINRFNKNPAMFERRQYTDYEKKKLLAYMNKFEPCAAVGKLDDCVTGEELDFENVGFEANGYIWTSQDIYHIANYYAAVTDDFLRLALNQAGPPEAARG